MDRHSESPGLEVPQRDVDDAEQPDRELLGPIQLPQPVPEPLALVGTLADQLLAQDAIDDVSEHRPAPFVVGLADRTVLGCDPQNRGGACPG